MNTDLGADLSAIPKWDGKGEIYELGGYLLNFMDKRAGLSVSR